jgi:RNA binding exosome subunit
MSRKKIVRQIIITVFTHATEDRKKVITAVRNLFHKDSEFPNYTESNLDGYFGDPIILFNFIIKKRRLSTELFNNIINGLSSLDYLTLINELPHRIDDVKNLYLRFDKQKAYLGKYVLNNHDPIRVKVSLTLPHKADPVEALRKYLEETRV